MKLGEVGDAYTTAYIDNNDRIPDVISDDTNVVDALIAADMELDAFTNSANGSDDAKLHWAAYIHILVALEEYCVRIRPGSVRLPQSRILYVRAPAMSATHAQIKARFRGGFSQRPLMVQLVY